MIDKIIAVNQQLVTVAKVDKVANLTKGVTAKLCDQHRDSTPTMSNKV